MTNITIQNNFTGGTVKVNTVEKNSPYTYSNIVGLPLSLEAVTPQNGNDGYQHIWNNFATNARSLWQRLKGSSTYDILPPNSQHNFVTTQADNKSKYIAGLRKNYKIDVDHQTEFNGLLEDQSVKYIVEQNNDQISSPVPHPINSQYKFAGWTDGNGDNPRTIWPDDNKTYTALYKIPSKSNEQNAYANNSQRKFVRTDDGWLHCVYESMGRVWYERSTNNGATWEIMNDGKPLSITESKNPSITIIGDFSVAITFQEEINGYYYIKVLNYNYILDAIWDSEIANDTWGNGEYFDDADPVISFTSKDFSRIIIVWKVKESGPFQPGGLYYRYGYLTGGASSSQDIVWLSDISIIDGSNNDSYNPTIDSRNSYHPLKFHLAWEQNNEIEYYCFDVDGSAINVHDYKKVSAGSGFIKNSNPSIIEINGGARICWIGTRYTEEEQRSAVSPEVTREQSVTVFKDPEYYRYWNFDNEVKSVSINKAPNYYALAWGRGNNYPVRYTISSRLSNPQSLSISGKDVQVCNGSSPNSVRAMAFNSNELPYYFTHSDIPLYKENLLAVGSGREGVVAKDSAQFYFAVGDIKVDGQPINFIEFDDTVSFYSNQRLNEFLVSEPFSLNDNSDFIYSVQYGITDSASAVSVLGNNDYINFKVELRDEQSGELLGLFDNINYTESNVDQYENIAYQVSTQGIGNRTVRLRLLVDNNINPSYALTDRYAEENALLKSTVKQISYQGSLAVKEYALEQNYPNPFNPSTTISWQSPVGSHQTLKVYDVLGREVVTLVNEWRDAGRYSIEFNASDLASGVYIYQLRANHFVATKKLMLLK